MRLASDELTDRTDDRTAKARIRDAAIECIAEHGLADTTARKVAITAGVSPGLVMHHFGSMDGLRAACDEHVAAIIRQEKQTALGAGPGIDVLAAFRSTRVWPFMGYLAEVLTEDSPAVRDLVDDLIADAEGYIQMGVETGMMKPSDDPRGRAVIMTVWHLGMLVFHRHLHRLLGVDLTDPAVGADPRLWAFVGPVYEIYGEGVLTEPFATQVRSAIAGLDGGSQNSKGTE